MYIDIYLFLLICLQIYICIYMHREAEEAALFEIFYELELDICAWLGTKNGEYIYIYGYVSI
jgi:hypothetical protein